MKNAKTTKKSKLRNNRVPTFKVMVSDDCTGNPRLSLAVTKDAVKRQEMRKWFALVHKTPQQLTHDVCFLLAPTAKQLWHCVIMYSLLGKEQTKWSLYSAGWRAKRVTVTI